MSEEVEVDDASTDDEIASPLLNAFSLVSGPRNESYGDFWTDYERTAELFRTMTHNKPVEMDAVHGIIFMICVKMSRLSHKLNSGVAYTNPESCIDDITDQGGYLEGLWKTLNHPEVFLPWQFQDEDGNPFIFGFDGTLGEVDPDGDDGEDE